VVKERKFSAHASQEKGRFSRTAKQAESVDHDGREGKALQTALAAIGSRPFFAK
jgi:hypothetical protein